MSINRPFASNEFAASFSVCNPRRAHGKNYIVYTVVGEDSHGRFEIQRRYKEFNLLRNVLSQRHPGLYVPPVPPKKSMGNTNQEFIEARCFYLNMFFKQLVRCPYLVKSDELNLFIRPQGDVERSLTYLPKLTTQKILEKLIPFYSIMGEVEQDALQPINLAINAFCI